MIRVARRIVRTEFTKKWETQVANPRLNMPQHRATFSDLKDELITEFLLGLD
jgi:hypothetical protein